MRSGHGSTLGTWEPLINKCERNVVATYTSSLGPQGLCHSNMLTARLVSEDGQAKTGQCRYLLVDQSWRLRICRR